MKYPSPIQTKLPGTGTSIFAVMSGLANEYKAINLSQGFPDFEVSPALIDKIHHFMKKGYNQYAPMPGVPEFRRNIVKKVKEMYGAEYDADREITITAGATQAIFTVIAAMVTVVRPSRSDTGPSVSPPKNDPTPISENMARACPSENPASSSRRATRKARTRMYEKPYAA